MAAGKGGVKFCKDFGDNPVCLGEADEKYTMYFDDIGKPPIYWCTHCGLRAQALDKAITTRIREDPGFAKELERAIAAAEKKTVH